MTETKKRKKRTPLKIEAPITPNITIEEVLEKIAQLVEQANQPKLWTTKHISEYLQRDIYAVRNRVINIPGFPQAIRLPTDSGTKGNPLWRAEEIKEWVMKYQENRVA